MPDDPPLFLRAAPFFEKEIKFPLDLPSSSFLSVITKKGVDPWIKEKQFK
jgi:hypothetical protein